jgi:hypothetical protein
LARGLAGLDGVGAVEQGRAAQPLGDVAGFADRGLGGLVIVQAEQVGGALWLDRRESTWP